MLSDGSNTGFRAVTVKDSGEVLFSYSQQEGIVTRVRVSRTNGGELLVTESVRPSRIDSGSGQGLSERAFVERCEAAKRLPDRIKSGLIAFGKDEEDALGVVLHFDEVEPLEEYLASRPGLDGPLVDALLAEWFALLAEVAIEPRLLPQISEQDVGVRWLDGCRLGIGLDLSGPLLRNDRIEGNGPILESWFRWLEAKASRRGLGNVRKRWRTLEKSGSAGLSDYFNAARDALVLDARNGSLSGLLGKARPSLLLDPGDSAHIPRGRLASFLRTSFEEDGQSRPGSRVPRPEVGQSMFRMRGIPHPDRDSYLLPPERGFEDTLVAPVTTKQGNSFLRGNPASVVATSFRCESNFTAIVAETGERSPLPVLRRLVVEPRLGATRDPMAEGIWRGEDLVIGLLKAVHQAIAAFDSTDFGLALESPWQIEMSGGGLDGVNHRSSKDLATMRPKLWEAKIRVEQPTECHLRVAMPVWAYLSDRLDHLFFPVLAIWLLEGERFEWAWQNDRIAEEPFNWNRGLDALFRACREHFDPSSARHRERFLSLLSEALSVG
ncbi:MAG: hypothetical protein AAF236_03820 [Verrucomicrobiota bacterium]